MLLLPPLFCSAMHGQGILDQTPYKQVVLALILDQAPIWLFSDKNVIVVTNVINCNGIIVKHA